MSVDKYNKRGNVRITLRRVSETIIALENKYYIFWVCICSLIYPARKADVP
jgi:hypothetical protein